MLRKCELYDGAELSGNAMHAENLLRLYRITFDEQYATEAEGIFKAAKILIDAYPPGACYHLLALSRYYDMTSPLLVIALDEEKSFMEEIQRELALLQNPHLAIVWKPFDDKELERLVPMLSDKIPVNAHTTLYLCRPNACEKPISFPEEILVALRRYTL